MLTSKISILLLSFCVVVSSRPLSLANRLGALGAFQDSCWMSFDKKLVSSSANPCHHSVNAPSGLSLCRLGGPLAPAAPLPCFTELFRS